VSCLTRTLTILFCCIGTLPARAVETRNATLNSIFAEYWEDHLARAPEEATALGDKRFNDRWSDYSVASINDRLRKNEQFISRLQAVDTVGLSEQDRLSATLLLRILKETRDGARFKEWEMPVNQIHGPDIDIPQLVAVMPFEDVQDYENYISRLHRLPALLEQLTANMTLGIREGRVATRVVALKVLAQVNDIAAIAPANSPFITPIRTFPASVNAVERERLTSLIRTAIARDVTPAYQRFAQFIEGHYIPQTRTRPGIDSIRDGRAYYDFCIRRNTTLAVSADEIHRIGLEEVERDTAAMLVIARSLGYENAKSLNAAMKDDPRLHVTSAEQLFDVYRRDLTRMQEKLPALFRTLPKANLIVEATPAYVERQRPAATYEPGTPDGKRPGRVVVNAYNFKDLLLGDAEAIAYHEGVPGHHLQMSVAQELEGLPEFRQQYSNTAYQEGWALYSEQLGKEVGFYEDPYSDYGRLQSDVWRAIRLVVDTGLHSKHWTREQVIAFFHDHSSVDETNVQREADRYIAWPGQALGYKIGQRKLLELRQRAQTELGTRFDIRDFHDLIIGSGALPLDILDARVSAWIVAVHRDVPFK
jgi:uncharacterized protein (DUF885 family)